MARCYKKAHRKFIRHE